VDCRGLLWQYLPLGAAIAAQCVIRDELPLLPEAPQHRKWREAREAARLEIDQLHADLIMLLGEATDLIHADPQPQSKTWRDLAERLANACKWLGSATYCLREWTEPGDTKADLAYGGLRETIPWSRDRTAPGVANARSGRAALAANELGA
jgi:hypothetical protein